MGFLDYILLIISILIIGIVLIQGGESNGLSGFTGKNELKLFENTKERGVKKLLTKVMTVMVIVFFSLVVLSKYLL